MFMTMCVMQGQWTRRGMDVKLVFLSNKKQIMYFQPFWLSVNDGGQHLGDLSISNMNSLR